LALFAVFAVVIELATSQPVAQLSPALQFKQNQLPPGQYLPARSAPIRTKSQQALRTLAPVISAVITRHTQEVVDVPMDDLRQSPAQIVIVEPHLQPVTIEFRSRSSPVKINTVHQPGEKGQVQQTRSEEEPDRIIHEVVKPVIQEIREIIQPFRKITQQILPVQEEVHSIVSKGEKRSELEQVTDDAALAGSSPSDEQVEQAAIQSGERTADPEPAPAAVPVVSTFQFQPQLQPAFIAAPLPLVPEPQNTVIQAGLVGGTRILPASDTVYEQQREIISAITAPGGLKKKRSANIFRFDLP
ncbi:DFP2-like protein, partial [Euroglyphus maynei]